MAAAWTGDGQKGLAMPDQYSLLRHSIRGTIHSLKLGVSAMDTGLTRDEALEFLEYIVQATDKMSTLLDQYEALPWPAPTPENAQAKIET
jgi:hypothetical protein